MRMRYDEVDDDFNTTMLGEAMVGNGSVDESLATVNLTTNNEERSWRSWRPDVLKTLLLTR